MRRTYLFLLSMVVVIARSSCTEVLEESGGAGGCLSIVKPVIPCNEYLKGKCKQPSRECCSGAKALDSFAKTAKARQLACVCLKNAMRAAKDINPKLISTIPNKCKIKTKLPPIGPNFNCSSIKSAHEGMLSFN